MAVAESEHSVRVPGTQRFAGGAAEPGSGPGTWPLRRAKTVSGCLAARRLRAARVGAGARDMAVAESEHSVKVPGTERFDGGRPSARLRSDDGRSGGALGV